jgi:sulfur-oxidizing protein SoxY
VSPAGFALAALPSPAGNRPRGIRGMSYPPRIQRGFEWDGPGAVRARAHLASVKQGDFLMKTRRDVLRHSAQLATLLMTAGLLPGVARAQGAAWNGAAFEAKSVADLMKTLGASAPVESKDVTLTGPDIAENGAVVPLGVATTLPGVKRLMLLVEKNPNVLSSIFEVSDAVDASINTRVKMSQSSNVYAVAMTADNRVLYAMKEVKVTLGGCGG